MEENKMIKQTKYGWVDLRSLPKKKNGTINWKMSVGTKINFQYDNIVSVILIVKYCDDHHVEVSVDGVYGTHIIKIGSIKNGQFSRLLNIPKPHGTKKDVVYNVGDIVNDMLLITGINKGEYKKYSFQCINDGYCGVIAKGDLNKGKGCPVCANKVVLYGINDITTTHPEIAKLFYDPEDAKKYTAFSNKYAYFRCPTCHTILHKRIYDVSTHGLSCNSCADGISYPNKVIFNMLNQICEKHSDNLQLQLFEPEKTFGWAINTYNDNNVLCGTKRYDFYIPLDDAIIIEAHGRQHFEDVLIWENQSRRLKDEQANDIFKQELAIKNGIKCSNYVVLDCRESNIEFIKKSILTSNLPVLLDFNEGDINWDTCDKFASSSRIFEVCQIWNDGIHITREIAQKMKLSTSSVSKYLRQCIALNLIQDTSKKI